MELHDVELALDGEGLVGGSGALRTGTAKSVRQLLEEGGGAGGRSGLVGLIGGEEAVGARVDIP